MVKGQHQAGHTEHCHLKYMLLFVNASYQDPLRGLTAQKNILRAK